MSEIIESQGKRLMLTGLYSRSSTGGIELNFGVYEQQAGREEWTGEHYSGIVPLKELLEWAVAQGYIQARWNHGVLGRPVK